MLMSKDYLHKEMDLMRRVIFINNLFLIFFLGALLNFTVMINNDLMMPVYFENLEDAHHSIHVYNVPTEYLPFNNFNDVTFGYLGDIFSLGRMKFSIGDFILFGSGFFIIISTCKMFYIKLKGGYRKWLYYKQQKKEA